MMRKTRLTVDSLAAERVLDKLAREKIPVYSAEKSAKNKITFCVATKDLEKVFAIFSGLCYNVTEVRPRGLSLLSRKLLEGVGLLVGFLLFCLFVLSAQSRVLKIEVVGSGAYYEERVLDVLTRAGVSPLSEMPKDTAKLSSEILGFPDVDYCSFRSSGGILTVEVEVGTNHTFRSVKGLCSPVKGKVEEILLVRGTPVVKEGDEVEEGQLLVDSYALYGEEKRSVVVIARVKIACPVSEVFEGDEESARSGAYLKYGELTQIETKQVDGGYLVTGIRHVEATMNLN